jgi:hypothetical protein
MTLAAPIIRDGAWFDRLYDGWDEIARTALAHGVTGLVLRRAATGQTVCWYLGSDGAVLSTHAAFLEGDVRTVLWRAAESWAVPLVKGSLSGTPDAVPPSSDLPPPLLAEIAGAWAAQNLGAIAIYPASWATTGGMMSGQTGLAIEDTRIAALLESRVSSEALIVASPFTGAPLRAQIVLDCDELAVHRFHDPEHDAAFYLTWQTRATMERPSFFCPKAHLIVSDQPDPALLPGRILAWYAAHPDHARQIAEAVPFKAHDYGLGRASALTDLKDEEPAVAAPLEHGGSESAAWALLRTTDGTGSALPAEQSPEDPRPGFLKRLFGGRRSKD